MTKLIAHRGGKGYGIENTKEAFTSVKNLFYDGVECDIQPCKTNELVVFHDLDLFRLGKINKKVNDLTKEELKKVVLSKEDFGVLRQSNILFFDEFLDIFKDNDLILLIEIKESCRMDDVIKAINMLNDRSIDPKRFVFIANMCSIDLMIEVKRMYPYLSIMYVARSNYQENIKKCLDNSIGFDACFSILDDEGQKYMNEFKKKGLPTSVWVVNDESEMNNYLDLDFITTDVLTWKNK